MSALHLLAALVGICTIALSNATYALDAPVVQLTRSDGERIEVVLLNGHNADGYNVYRDSTYRSTVVPDQSRFYFDGADGSYCLVAFRKTDSGVEFSTCSTTHVISSPSGGSTDSVRPATDIRVERYSTQAAEVFWRASPDHSQLAGYEVHRDGLLLTTTDGRSWFDNTLNASLTSPRYTVTAISRSGARSRVASNNSHSTARTRTGLVLSHTSLQLVEGSINSAIVDVRLPGGRAASQDIRLTVREGSSGALRQLRTRFEPAVIARGNNSTRLLVTLDIDIAPLLRHERRVVVQALEGDKQHETELILNIEPVAADDVYLLIGQSNMEGYSEQGAKQASPGQLDAPVERIRQLNVKPNSTSVFWRNDLFRNAEYNLAGPRFVTAEDPLHEPRNTGLSGKGGTVVGPALSFAKTALLRTTRRIYLVPAAWSATGFCANAMGDIAWNVTPYRQDGLGGSLLTQRALTRLNLTLHETGGILRGILWHQGGADANDARCANRYAENLKLLVEHLRRQARPDARGTGARGPQAAIPFIVATQSRGADARGDFSIWSDNKQRVDSVHRAISSLIPFSDFVNNDDLVPPAFPCGSNSCVHFGAAASRETGRRFDAALRRIVQAAGQMTP